MRAAAAALACLKLTTGISAAAGPPLPAAFERGATKSDRLPASFRGFAGALGEGRPYQSRRIAALAGTKRVWTLYIFKQQRKRPIFRQGTITQGEPSLHVCAFVFTRDRGDAQGGGGGGCSPADRHFAGGRDISASSSRVIAGVASDRVERVAIVGSLGRVHRVPLTRLRTAIARACKAAGVPVFSPHDLRHRRISLLHRQGRTWAEIGRLVGQRKLSVTADTYTHVLSDGRELDYPALVSELGLGQR